jgi:hypothetical protein
MNPLKDDNASRAAPSSRPTTLSAARTHASGQIATRLRAMARRSGHAGRGPDSPEPARRAGNDSLMLTAPWPVRAAFTALEYGAPALGARAMLRFATTVPKVPAQVLARRPEDLPTGTPLTLTVDGQRIATWSWGDGDRVVYLVHGWGGWGLQMSWFVGDLVRRGARVVAYDGPGHGQSDGRRPLTAKVGCTALAAVVEHYGPAYGIIAHSSGSVITVHLIERGILTPQRLAFIAPRASAASALEAVAPRVGIGERILSRTVAAYERIQRASLDEYDGLRIAPGLGYIPAMVVLDAGDREVEPARHGIALAGAWPGARLEVIDRGLGHLRILRDPEVIEMVGDFVDGRS